jgi:hypothetical protein
MGAEQGLAHDSFIRPPSSLSNKNISCRTSDCQQTRHSSYAPASSPGIPTKCLPRYPDSHSRGHVPSRYPHWQCPIWPLVPGMICAQVNKASPITRGPPAIGASYSTSHYLPPTIILAPLQANFSDFCHTTAKGSYTAFSVREKASEVFLIGPCCG